MSPKNSDFASHISRMNEFIKSAKDAQGNICGPTCKRQQKIDALKRVYDGAKEKIKSAPSDLLVAEKNYYQLVEGDAEFANRMERRYKKEAAETKRNNSS